MLTVSGKLQSMRLCFSLLPIEVPGAPFCALLYAVLLVLPVAEAKATERSSPSAKRSPTTQLFPSIDADSTEVGEASEAEPTAEPAAAGTDAAAKADAPADAKADSKPEPATRKRAAKARGSLVAARLQVTSRPGVLLANRAMRTTSSLVSPSCKKESPGAALRDACECKCSPHAPPRSMFFFY